MKLAALSLVLTCGAAVAQEQAIEPHVDGRVLDLSVNITGDDFRDNGPIWWRSDFSKVGAKSIRLFLRVVEGTELPAVIEVDGEDGVGRSYDIADIGTNGRWTGMFPGGRVVISLFSDTRPDGLSLMIEEMAIETETGTLYSIWGGEDETAHINDAAVPQYIRDLGAPVAKLSFFLGGKPRSCTGTLINRDHLLTNQHCVADAATCRSAIAVFGYERTADNRLRLGQQFDCAEVKEVLVNFELDASLIRLDGTPGDTFGFYSIDPVATDAAISEELAIIQHPGGNEKQISFINCTVMALPVDGRANETDFSHTCDTAGGSSGSPVFNANGVLVGLHHYGFNDGQIEEWTENRAVRMSGITDWLQQQGIVQSPSDGATSEGTNSTPGD